MNTTTHLLSRLRELREDLLQSHDLRNPLTLIVSQDAGGLSDVLPLPSSATWWRDNPQWEEEAFNRRCWWSQCHANRDANARLIWNCSVYDRDHFTTAHSLTIERLSRIVLRTELEAFWRYFIYRDMPHCTTANAWFYCLCEIAWMDPLAVSSWDHTTPIVAHGPSSTEKYQEHRARTRLNFASQLGLPEIPFFGCAGTIGDENQPQFLALIHCHWWTEFYDLIGASIEAIDWISGFLHKQSILELKNEPRSTPENVGYAIGTILKHKMRIEEAQLLGQQEPAADAPPIEAAKSADAQNLIAKAHSAWKCYVLKNPNRMSKEEWLNCHNGKFPGITKAQIEAFDQAQRRDSSRDRQKEKQRKKNQSSE